MRYNQNESFEEWANRVVMYEKGRALQQIASGKNIEEVLEEMSKKITDKLLYPIHKVIKDSSPVITDEQLKEHKLRYENIMKNVGKAADQVDGPIFTRP
jgi:glutamyl-tRNA reductase